MCNRTYLEVVVGRQHGDGCVQLLAVQNIIGDLLPHEALYGSTGGSRARAGRGGRRGVRDQSAGGLEAGREWG